MTQRLQFQYSGSYRGSHSGQQMKRMRTVDDTRIEMHLRFGVRDATFMSGFTANGGMFGAAIADEPHASTTINQLQAIQTFLAGKSMQKKAELSLRLGCITWSCPSPDDDHLTPQHRPPNMMFSLLRRNLAAGGCSSLIPDVCA